MTKGKLIVLYGTNNLGKSTQAKLLIDKLKKNGNDIEFLKYPIYDLEPTGPKLNDILRSGKPQKMSEIELQELYAQNRHDFEPQLKKMLGSGKIIIAECYIGTGLAWGLTKGAPLDKLEQQNKNLIKEDIAILLDGEPYAEAQEKNHLHETKNDLMRKCRDNFLALAQRYNYEIINANQPKEEIADQIWKIVQNKIN